MNKNNLVSIIINNYNYGRFLADAIDSAINQTYSNLEVIVVDDGSTDESTTIIARYGNEIIPVLKKNGGQGSAFNAGFNKSKGEIIIFLDSDDTLLPAVVANVVEAFDTLTVAKVHWAMWRINASGEKTGGVVPQHSLIGGNLLDVLVKYGPDQCGGPPYSPPTSGNAWSRRFLSQVLPMPEVKFKLGADQYLFVLAPVFGALQTLPEVQGYYRVHGNNDTQKPLDVYMNEFFARYEYCHQILSRLLHSKDIAVNPDTWTRSSWYHQIHEAKQEIITLVLPKNSFILVDEDLWKTSDFGTGRSRIPFLERNGEYWGLPANDKVAIQELERMQQFGASFIIFPWFSFWWLNYYSGLYDYLKSNYECKLQNERLLVFSLLKHAFDPIKLKGYEDNNLSKQTIL